jgi:hypothetical protein
MRVRLPKDLPTLKCLYGIFVSVSSAAGYFYQTFIGYRTDGGWHTSAGSTNPALSCDLACPPYQVNGVQYAPHAGHLFELGVKLDGTNAIAYFIDSTAGDYHEVFKLPDSTLVPGGVGVILESYDIDEGDLAKVGGDNSFEVTNCGWFPAPGVSSGWPHGTVYGPTSHSGGYEPVPHNVTIAFVAPQHFYIGHKVGLTPQQLW